MKIDLPCASEAQDQGQADTHTDAINNQAKGSLKRYFGFAAVAVGLLLLVSMTVFYFASTGPIQGDLPATPTSITTPNPAIDAQVAETPGQVISAQPQVSWLARRGPIIVTFTACFIVLSVILAVSLHLYYKQEAEKLRLAALEEDRILRMEEEKAEQDDTEEEPLTKWNLWPVAKVVFISSWLSLIPFILLVLRERTFVVRDLNWYKWYVLAVCIMGAGLPCLLLFWLSIVLEKLVRVCAKTPSGFQKTILRALITVFVVFDAFLMALTAPVWFMLDFCFSEKTFSHFKNVFVEAKEELNSKTTFVGGDNPASSILRRFSPN